MTGETSQLLSRLKANRLPGLDLPEGLVVPDLSGHSLLNVPATVCRLLGAPAPTVAASLPEDLIEQFGAGIRHVVLIVIDGLGLDRFTRALEENDPPVWRRLQADGILTPLTSISPSTTAAALTTLWTGVAPGTHGIVGYELWLKEYGLVANMITHSAMSYANDAGGLQRSSFAPEAFLPVPPLGPHLEENHIRAQAFMYHSLVRSGLSSMHLPKMKVYPFRSDADLWISAREWMDTHPKDRIYTYIYWSDLDEISHRFGPQDPRPNADFAAFSGMFEREFINPLARRPYKDTLVLVTADHGLIHTPHSSRFDLRHHPELTSRLHIMPTGENRLAYLFVRPGQTEAVRNYIQQTWPGKFVTLTGEEVIHSGLFGPGPNSPRLADRVGDLVVIAKGDAYLWWADKENQMRGRHGGLSPQEMLIPLFGFRL